MQNRHTACFQAYYTCANINQYGEAFHLPNRKAYFYLANGNVEYRESSIQRFPQRFGNTMKDLDPIALSEVLIELGINATPVISEEPDLDPHTIELSNGLAIIMPQDQPMTLVRDLGSRVAQLDDFDTMADLIEGVRDAITM